MATTEEIVMALRDHHAALRLRYLIQRMALFGSWARGEAREAKMWERTEPELVDA